MTECFGDAAVRLCHAASSLLGWRPNEFWASTPAELLLTLRPPAERPDSPDQATIETLRRRFPDE